MPEDENKVGGRTDKQIADLLFGDTMGKGKPAVEPEPQEPVVERETPWTEAEISRLVYPPQSPRYAKVFEDGTQASVIRDTEGNILHGKEGVAKYSDIRDMISSNSKHLTNASLTNIDFGARGLQDARLSGADLSGSAFHGSLRGSDLKGADLRGTSLVGCDLRLADLRDIVADHLTDLEGVDLEGAKYNYKELTRCKNWEKAKNLRMDADK